MASLRRTGIKFVSPYHLQEWRAIGRLMSFLCLAPPSMFSCVLLNFGNLFPFLSQGSDVQFPVKRTGMRNYVSSLSARVKGNWQTDFCSHLSSPSLLCLHVYCVIQSHSYLKLWWNCVSLLSARVTGNWQADVCSLLSSPFYVCMCIVYTKLVIHSHSYLKLW